MQFSHAALYMTRQQFELGLAQVPVLAVQVTTQRSFGNRKVVWPCLTDTVKGLEGCRTKICQNLSDIRAYAAEIGAVVPEDCRNEVSTGEVWSGFVPECFCLCL